MSETLWTLFIEPLTQQSFQKALIGGSLVAIVGGVIGCFVILRRMAFLGDALAHCMLAGVTAGFLVMSFLVGEGANTPAMLLGSVIAGVSTVFLIGFISRVSRIKEDTAIGVMYTGVFAIGGILASYFSHRVHIDLYHFVAGMVLAVDDGKLWMMAVVTALVLAVVILFYRQLLICSFDPIMAASIGIPVLAFEYLLTACTSLVVVGGVSLVGVVLVVGLIVTPAATAYLISDRLERMQVLAAVFGVTGVLGGLYMSTWIGNIATGPSIVLVTWFQFMVVLVVAPRYGLIADSWRRYTMVPQQIVEDVLGAFRKLDGDSVTQDQILAFVDGKQDIVRRAIRSLLKQDLLQIDGQHLKLTEEGEQMARKLLRAHRLWETYLEHVGTPQAELHDQAHRLEHMHDEETVDYLDDKLGHPLVDPHGSEIPEDFVHLVPGEEVRASLLREGHRGEVTEVEGGIGGLQVGDEIVAGPRSDDGQTWTFHISAGDRLELNHAEADSVRVRFLSPDEPPSAG